MFEGSILKAVRLKFRLVRISEELELQITSSWIQSQGGITTQDYLDEP